MTIRPARSATDIETARALFLEYASSLGFDLCFQGFDRELAALPGDYAPPRGRLLLAWEGATPAGCVALRPIDESTCEMKRLYVRPVHRGGGAGRALVRAILAEGRSLGYLRMRLDTVPAMKEAIALYRSLGFRDIPPYTANPIPGARHLEIDLAGVPPGRA